MYIHMYVHVCEQVKRTGPPHQISRESLLWALSCGLPGEGWQEEPQRGDPLTWRKRRVEETVRMSEGERMWERECGNEEYQNVMHKGTHTMTLYLHVHICL